MKGHNDTPSAFRVNINVMAALDAVKNKAPSLEELDNFSRCKNGDFRHG